MKSNTFFFFFRSQFSFCQYPFLLSMAAKKAVLQKDSEHQMLIMAKVYSIDAIVGSECLMWCDACLVQRSIAEKVQQNTAPHARHFFLNLNVRRSHLIADSISEVCKPNPTKHVSTINSYFIYTPVLQLMQKQEDLKKKVRVTFSGEPGVDVGGLSKEWFLLLIRKVFQPEYGEGGLAWLACLLYSLDGCIDIYYCICLTVPTGLFVYHEDSGCYWFNPGLTKDFHNEYHLVGLVWKHSNVRRCPFQWYLSALITPQCYDAEICTILLLLRCPFRWYPFLPGSKFSVLGRKPWTIVHGLIFASPKKVLR